MKTVNFNYPGNNATKNWIKNNQSRFDSPIQTVSVEGDDLLAAVLLGFNGLSTIVRTVKNGFSSKGNQLYVINYVIN